MTPADPTPDIATPEDIEAQCGHMLVDAARLRMKRGAPGDAHEIRHLHAAITWGNTDDCDPAACKLDRLASAERIAVDRDVLSARLTDLENALAASADRLARAEAAVPDDPWLYDDGRGYGLTCYSCVQWKDLGHRENCKWLAARPAR
jgi:hypothetical protein